MSGLNTDIATNAPATAGFSCNTAEYAAGPLVGSYPRSFSDVKRIGPVYFAATAPPVPGRRWTGWS